MTSTTLTVRQTKFVEEYVVSGNAAEAARAAGYSANGAKVTACRMLTKANLKAAIAAKRQAGAEKFELRREHVVTAILQAIAMAKACRKPATMLSGWVAIGKMLGLYDPATLKAEKLRKNSDGSENVRHVPTSELLNRISEDGVFRNLDGSPMRPGQIDEFYKGLSDEVLTALCEGRARVVTKIEFLPLTPELALQGVGQGSK
jgi:hypothetical protein